LLVVVLLDCVLVEKRNVGDEVVGGVAHPIRRASGTKAEEDDVVAIHATSDKNRYLISQYNVALGNENSRD
jgi:hypothetical protein